jgi:hypothetical protein
MNEESGLLGMLCVELSRAHCVQPFVLWILAELYVLPGSLLPRCFTSTTSASALGLGVLR